MKQLFAVQILSHALDGLKAEWNSLATGHARALQININWASDIFIVWILAQSLHAFAANGTSDSWLYSFLQGLVIGFLFSFTCFGFSKLLLGAIKIVSKVLNGFRRKMRVERPRRNSSKKDSAKQRSKRIGVQEILNKLFNGHINPRVVVVVGPRRGGCPGGAVFLSHTVLIAAAATLLTACAPGDGGGAGAEPLTSLSEIECSQVIKQSTLEGSLPSLREYVNQNDVIEYDGASRWVTDDCKARITQASMRGAM